MKKNIILIVLIFFIINSNLFSTVKNNSDKNILNNSEIAFGGSVSLFIQAKYVGQKMYELDMSSMEYRKFFMPIFKIPFQFSFYYSKIMSKNHFGFSFQVGYAPGFSTFIHSYLHSIINKFNFRYSFSGKKDNKRFIFESGLLTEVELHQFINSTGYNNDHYYVDGSLFISFGPVINLGFEHIYKNFSFEFIGFIGSTFGIEGFEDGYIDLKGSNINITSGIELRFNYYLNFRI